MYGFSNVKVSVKKTINVSFIEMDTFTDAARLETGVRQITSLLFTNVASTSMLPKLHLSMLVGPKFVPNKCTVVFPNLDPDCGMKDDAVTLLCNVKCES